LRAKSSRTLEAKIKFFNQKIKTFKLFIEHFEFWLAKFFNQNSKWDYLARGAGLARASSDALGHTVFYQFVGPGHTVFSQFVEPS